MHHDHDLPPTFENELALVQHLLEEDDDALSLRPNAPELRPPTPK